MNAITQAIQLHSATVAVREVPLALTQYLTFLVGTEVFGIGILAVKEIIEYRGMTEVPLTPACVRGVINLRGAVVPVVDLQARFGRASSAVSKRSCIVIVEVQTDDSRAVIGVLVDAVNAVLDIAAAEIEPPPNFGTRIRRDFIHGMGKVKDRFVILLNVDEVLALDELGRFEPNPSEVPVELIQ
ncbi:chemotaxis protein CheW [Roseateles sp. GG27B]